MGGNPFTSFPSAVGPVGGWVELGRTKLLAINPAEPVTTATRIL